MRSLTPEEFRLFKMAREFSDFINKNYSQEGRKVILDILCIVILFATDGKLMCHIHENPEGEFEMHVAPKGDDSYAKKYRFN